ncbi:unnamed protein product [Urochloa humidicola]
MVVAAAMGAMVAVVVVVAATVVVVPTTARRNPSASCVAGRARHTVIRCYKRFDASFTGIPDKSANTASTSSYGVDTNWYADSGSTDHITSELEKLSMKDKYSGTDQVHTASGAGSGHEEGSA